MWVSLAGAKFVGAEKNTERCNRLYQLAILLPQRPGVREEENLTNMSS